MEVASLQQPPATEAVANTVEPSMDIDMDLDLGPLPEADAIETVRRFTFATHVEFESESNSLCLGRRPATSSSPARRRRRPEHRRSAA